MEIRKAKMQDLGAMMAVYAYARELMRRSGNPDQWGNTQPTQGMIEADIRAQASYVVEENGTVCGVFYFHLGPDETYRTIEGRWLNDEDYGVIHRIASNGTARGVFEHCLAFCEKQAANLRIDTHRDNKIMQHKLAKNGFTQCGIIHLQDGSPRLAYQKCLRMAR